MATARRCTPPAARSSRHRLPKTTSSRRRSPPERRRKPRDQGSPGWSSRFLPRCPDPSAKRHPCPLPSRTLVIPCSSLRARIRRVADFLIRTGGALAHSDRHRSDEGGIQARKRDGGDDRMLATERGGRLRRERQGQGRRTLQDQERSGAWDNLSARPVRGLREMCGIACAKEGLR